MWLEGVSEESRGRQGQVLMGRALGAMGRLVCTFTPSEVGAIEDSEQRRNGKPGNLGGADSKEAPCPESHRVVGWKCLQGFPSSFFPQWRPCLPPHPGFHHLLLLRDTGPSVFSPFLGGLLWLAPSLGLAIRSDLCCPNICPQAQPSPPML